MDSIWVGVAEWALTGVLAIVATALARTLRSMQKKFDALEKGLQILLRADLIRIHREWIVDRGHMPVDTKRLWRDMFCAYEALGENGVISALYDDVRDAHVAPDTDDTITKNDKENNK